MRNKTWDVLILSDVMSAENLVKLKSRTISHATIEDKMTGVLEDIISKFAYQLK